MFSLILLGESPLGVHPAIYHKVVLRSGRNGIFDINITGEVTVLDAGNRRCGIRFIEIQTDGGLFPAVGQDCTVVRAVKLMESEVITVDIELTTVIAPFDIVGIDLFFIA